MTLEEYVLSLKDKKICFIGAGISNKPLIKLLLLSGHSVTVCDMREPEKLTLDDLSLISLGAKYKLGNNYLDDFHYDIVFRSPSFLPFHPVLEKAAKEGTVVTSEMEVFFQLCPCKTIAITGSDGKTTTSTIISKLLAEEGYAVHLGGNIGNPLLCEIPLYGKNDIAVLELSSFQLHSMNCSPDVSVITNISPNHLDKHKDYTDYIEAKKQIFFNQKPGSKLVLNANDSICQSFSEEAVADVHWFSDEYEILNGCNFQNGTIYRTFNGEKSAVMNADEILLKGHHNILNYLAAIAATSGLVSDETCRKVANTFKGVEHRLEFVDCIDGITYINDSIGTSPTRTIVGLHSLPVKPIVILGGYDKKIGFAELGSEVCRLAKAAVLTGDTADKIYDSIVSSECFPNSKLQLFRADNLQEAVLIAKETAISGDIVLLSPACAAFDSFKNFEERGRVFKSIVSGLKKDG